ncbi:serine hydrolase [Streptomyces sp. NPDC001292]|uniref:serine hydrolase n=1 Tax=Streptomyces sp. NPDC001292 TaxID=3364558 RepID=UPI0036AD077E
MPDLRARLDSAVPDLLAEHRVPGAAVGVALDGRICATGYGVTHVVHPIGVDENTLFQVGSISRTLLGAVIGRLMEQGVLELDPVARSSARTRASTGASPCATRSPHLASTPRT